MIPEVKRDSMNIAIAGGGASGMLCAILSAERGCRVTLIEQNEKLGKKLYITGQGRCNFTNDCTQEEFLAHVISNPRFLYSASAAFTPQDMIARLESWGLRTKVERGRRAFPASDRSADVLDTLKAQLKKKKVRVLLNTKVTGLLTDEQGDVTGVRILSGGAESELPADHVVLATGGISYPSTGSTGDGYRFARELGLKVTPLYPSLVPISCPEEYIREMQGLSLKNVELSVRAGKKVLFREFGEMMFTHFGITGPLVLSLSAVLGPSVGKKDLTCRIDLKPAVSEEELDARLVKLFAASPNKALKTLLHELYPAKMQPVIPVIAGIDPDRKAHEITRAERAALVGATKRFPLTLSALRGYNEAVVTKGGVAVSGIVPGTMCVKSRQHVSVIGELLDLDAFTGGYNLQIAWCTAAACAAGLPCGQEK